MMFSDLRGNNQGVIKIVTNGLDKDPEAKVCVVYRVPLSALHAPKHCQKRFGPNGTRRRWFACALLELGLCGIMPHGLHMLLGGLCTCLHIQSESEPGVIDRSYSPRCQKIQRFNLYQMHRHGKRELLLISRGALCVPAAY